MAHCSAATRNAPHAQMQETFNSCSFNDKLDYTYPLYKVLFLLYVDFGYNTLQVLARLDSLRFLNFCTI